jgi:tyrosyl-tRNA synthetase
VTRPATHTLDTLLGELAWRGLLADKTPGLEARLATGRPLAAYNGMDPSGPSLHLGHLVPIFGLLHLQRHGGKPVLLVGGATGMIGDPSGTSAERNLLDRDTIAVNVAGIRSQLGRFLDFEPGSGAATLVNNLDWLGGITMLDFLRDIGKHFTVPYMLAKDSVSARLDAGLSYTEFSYMLLQAADFQHLYRTMGVEAQVGGADQWGNITAGLELIRKTLSGPLGEAAEAFALSYPLLLDPSGAKFGKTSVGTSVWLDPARTSPYAFYQFLVDRPDSEVGKLLRLFTIMDRPEIDALEAEQAAHPERRPAQRALALDLTTRVHGVAETERAVTVSHAVFGEEPVRDPSVLAAMYEVLEHCDLTAEDLAGGALRVAIASGLFASNSDARRAISQGGFSINDVRVSAPEDVVPPPIGGRWLLLRAGRKRLRIGRVGGGSEARP